MDILRCHIHKDLGWVRFPDLIPLMLKLVTQGIRVWMSIVYRNPPLFCVCSEFLYLIVNNTNKDYDYLSIINDEKKTYDCLSYHKWWEGSFIFSSLFGHHMVVICRIISRQYITYHLSPPPPSKVRFGTLLRGARSMTFSSTDTWAFEICSRKSGYPDAHALSIFYLIPLLL